MNDRIKIIEADSVSLLRGAVRSIPAILTSMPDAEEIGGNIPGWREWYADAARVTMRSVATGGAIVFFCTDRRADGGIESKAGIILSAAQDTGLRPLWHKIVVNTHGSSLFRPSYSHLLAFGSGKGVNAGTPTPDVLMTPGTRDYRNAIPVGAIDVAIELLEKTGSNVLVDPFCGWGSSLAQWTNHDPEHTAVGIDNDPDQLAHAQQRYYAEPASVDDLEELIA